MVRKTPLPVIFYNPYLLPPRQYWKIPCNILRNSAGTFIENLHALIHDMQGAAFYCPDTVAKTNECRFEWNRKLNGDRFGLRLGLKIIVTEAPITEIEAYVTTKELLNVTNGIVPEFEAKLIADIQQEIFALLHRAEEGEGASELKEWLVVFHIELPYSLGFKASIESINGHFKFLKTRIFSGNLSRISAVIVRSRAWTKESAKAKAARDINIALALLTLAERNRYKLATITWPRAKSFTEVFFAEAIINEDALYPRRRHITEAEVMDEGIIGRFEILWSAFEKLEGENKKLFTSALFAHYGAVYQHINHSALSVIGHMAALAALSQPLRKKCSGKITCEVCGDLSWKHDEKSEVSAIVETIVNTCEIKNEQIAELKEMIQRVHRKQRSAFVHSAQFRHAEYNQEPNIPAVPSNTAATNDLFQYSEDLTSISGIARRTLIEWLLKKSGAKLNREQMKINPERVTHKTLMTASMTASSKFVTTMAVRPPTEDIKSVLPLVPVSQD